eukprot:gnl/TRDRNA2_/TRDRNA2_60740_c0_seq1.p2 gnl/TRDRNA2_/TRDRNA2_60740_c0~~gnl/TRDRNA2_/TRDRNA2_60740_c0_seq1.p2  ORF type:complete len:179 (+),score=34.10 gnl/TRDRNA2_/TRDRNA2_60740_c0_seq1:121-657(+)
MFQRRISGLYLAVLLVFLAATEGRRSGPATPQTPVAAQVKNGTAVKTATGGPKLLSALGLKVRVDEKPNHDNMKTKHHRKKPAGGYREKHKNPRVHDMDEPLPDDTFGGENTVGMTSDESLDPRDWGVADAASTSPGFWVPTLSMIGGVLAVGGTWFINRKALQQQQQQQDGSQGLKA